MCSRELRGSVQPPDDEFLPPFDLELEPRARATTGIVASVAPLCDHALPPVASRLPQHRCSILAHVSEAKRAKAPRAAHQRREVLSAHMPRFGDHDLLPVEQDVEHHERDGMLGAKRARSPFRSVTCMRPCSAWNRAGASRCVATISPSITNGRLTRAYSDRSASATSGNCRVLSIPFRLTSATRRPSADARIRMPSYFGSNTQLPRPREVGSDGRQHRRECLHALWRVARLARCVARARGFFAAAW